VKSHNVARTTTATPPRIRNDHMLNSTLVLGARV
jgi:hypothetical protein